MKALSIVVLSAALTVTALANDKKPFYVHELVIIERVSSPVFSPDGKLAVFAVRQVDLTANKTTTGLWIENLVARDTLPPTRFTNASLNVNSPSFSPDGTLVYFLSAKSGTMQLWSQALDSKSATQLSNFYLDIGTYKISPDGQSIAFTFEVYNDCADLACSKKRLDEVAARKASGKIYDKLFIRHWDAFADGRRNQLFVAPLTAGKVGTPIKISRNIDGDVPSKPFGDASEYTWAPDGMSIVFSVRIAGKTEPWSTNFDLYRVDTTGKSNPQNLTASNLAWDTAPVFSPDGKTVYYLAMKRPGFEADRLAIMSLELKTGNQREVAPNWDRSAGSLSISDDGTTLFALADDVGQHPLFAITIEDGTVRKLAANGSVREYTVSGNQILFARDRLDSPAQLFLTDKSGKTERLISANNREALANTAWGSFEQFQFAGWNDETVHGYVVKPANYVKGRKYPIAFLIHGGPLSSFGNGWSYRWNPQTYAGQGYAVVMIDFHGSTGYGQAFTDSISQHWGDRPLEDLQKGYTAALAKYDFLDKDRACALGASYGGFMTNWIAGNWYNADGSKPFKCLVTHNGVFDTRSMGLVTEELWFTEWEFGGTVWDKPEAYEQFNPARFVDKWTTPSLIVAGQNDFRVPIDQSFSAFTALQRQGIESKLLYFPDENHWVLKPQNSILWHDTVNDWLKLWTAEK